MRTVTFRIPQRTNAKDPIAIEFLEWKNGSLKGVRAKKYMAADSILVKAAELKALKGVLGEPNLNTIQTAGQDLVTALFGKVSAAIPPNARIYLDIEDKWLAPLPWEILQSGQYPYAVDPKYSLIRTPKLALKLALGRDPRPLKVLVLLSLPPKEDVGGYAEVDSLKRLFWKYDHSFDCVLVDTAETPLVDRDAISALLTRHRPDIFHFIGHGEASHLLIQKTDVKTWQWTANDIGIALRGGYCPPIVYLNACRTHDNDATNANRAGSLDMGSVASAFLNEGASATVSMQGDVNGKAAGKASTAFYGALVEGKSLEEAMRKLRGSFGSGSKECYFPVFTVTAAVESILPERVVLDRQRSRSLDNSAQMKQLESFIDRHEDRRILIRNFLQSDVEEKNRYSAALIEGNSLTGKTCFCFWWVRMCVWQNMLAYYMVPSEIQDLENFNWLESVHQICEGSTAMGELAPALPYKAVRNFYWELEQIIAGKEAPFLSVPDGFQPRRRTLKEIYASGRASNDFPEKALGAFHDALKLAANDGKLVLIFDHWIGKGPGMTDVEILKNYLLDPIAADAGGPIRVIVVAGSDSKAGVTSPLSVRFNTNWHRVSIDDFDMRYMRDLMIEFIERYTDASTNSLVTTPKPITGRVEYRSPKDAVEVIKGVLVNLFGIPLDRAEAGGRP